MFIPIGTQQFKSPYLGSGAYMFAYTRTNIVVTNTNQTDGLRGILRQTVDINALWQLVAGDILESYRQVFLYQLVHPSLNLLLLLTARLAIQMKTHLTLLPLNMGIIGTLTTKETDHSLVE